MVYCVVQSGVTIDSWTKTRAKHSCYQNYERYIRYVLMTRLRLFKMWLRNTNAWKWIAFPIIQMWHSQQADLSVSLGRRSLKLFVLLQTSILVSLSKQFLKYKVIYSLSLPPLVKVKLNLYFPSIENLLMPLANVRLRAGNRSRQQRSSTQRPHRWVRSNESSQSPRLPRSRYPDFSGQRSHREQFRRWFRSCLIRKRKQILIEFVIDIL